MRVAQIRDGCISKFRFVKRLVLALRREMRLRLPELAPGRIVRRRRVEKAIQSRSTFVVDLRAIGARMIVDPEMSFAWQYVLGSYEIPLVRSLRKVLRPGMVCVDVGANVGYFSLLMANLVGPNGRVFSFEPTRRTFDALKANVHLNDLENIVVERLALFDHNGVLEFREGPPGYDAYNSAGEITHPSAAQQIFTSHNVPCTTLDAYLDARGIRHVDLIKIDVEGAELIVLKGMQNILEENPGLKLAIEFADKTTAGFGYRARDIGLWLMERGWQLSVVKSLCRTSFLLDRQDLIRRRWFGQGVLASRFPLD
jgi:FkbM family methyltransferase